MKIYDRFDGSKVLFENESGTMRETVLAAIATSANLTSANLTSANLTYANLRSANLTSANLTYANLRSANLTYANLRSANLSHIKQDFWDVLLRAPNEIGGLIAALREGRVNGSAYEGDCACLVGTIANVAHCNYQKLELITPNSSRPAERWFLAIQKGHTPDKSSVAKLTIEWAEEFEQLLTRAIALRATPQPAEATDGQ